MKLFIKLFVPFLLLNFYSGYATFPKKKEFYSGLKKSNIHYINGKYRITEFYSEPTKDTTALWNFTDSDIGMYPTLYDELNNGLFVKPLERESSKIYSFKLEIQNNRKIEINYYEEDSIIRQN